MRVFMTTALLVFMVALSGPVQARGKAKYPAIQFLQGSSFQVSKAVTIAKKVPQVSEKRKLLKKGSILREQALLETAEKSELRLALSPHATLVVKENSLVQIPAIHWKNGAIEEIVLKRGAVRYICHEIKDEKCARSLKTDLYEAKLATGDYVLRYAPRIPEVSMEVLKGEALFGGIENENPLVLHAGEKASFTGELENEEPAFDILLQGRRVARGKASGIQKIAESDLKEYEKQEALHRKKMKEPPKSKRTSKQICDKPWGEFNQCAWVCEKRPLKAKSKEPKGQEAKGQGCPVDKGAQCVRMRCSANGEWTDRYQLPPSQEKCGREPLVSGCDY